jgi:hypothetical protein
MYYYGYNNYGMNTNPCYMSNPGFAGYTTGGYSWGAALWIVLFILLVIIIGAGWTGYNNND